MNVKFIGKTNDFQGDLTDALAETTSLLQVSSQEVEPAVFYAVQVGRTPGVYSDSAAAVEQVKNYPGSLIRRFSNRGEAEAYVQETVSMIAFALAETSVTQPPKFIVKNCICRINVSQNILNFVHKSTEHHSSQVLLVIWCLL